MPLQIRIFQHVEYESPGSIETWCKKHGHRLMLTRLFRGERSPANDPSDWLIILGGPMNVYQEREFPWLAGEKAAISRAVDAGKTVVGICLGAQLIAAVLGAQITRNDHKEIGWFNMQLTESAIKTGWFDDFDLRIPFLHWHGDTFGIPVGATRLAFSQACRNQAFCYGDRVLGLQFHLEVTSKGLVHLLRHGSEELIPGDFVQNSEMIRSGAAFIKPNNDRMAQLLDKLNTHAPQ